VEGEGGRREKGTNESRKSVLSEGGGGEELNMRWMLTRSTLMSTITKRIGTKTVYTMRGSSTKFSILSSLCCVADDVQRPKRRKEFEGESKDQTPKMMKVVLLISSFTALIVALLLVSRIELVADDLCGEDMAFVPAGSFLMGSRERERYEGDGETPLRTVSITSPFCIDKTETTNDAFRRFVEGAGYVTESERVGWSFVLESQLSPNTVANRSVDRAEWWAQVFGASWVCAISSLLFDPQRWPSPCAWR